VAELRMSGEQRGAVKRQRNAEGKREEPRLATVEKRKKRSGWGSREKGRSVSSLGEGGERAVNLFLLHGRKKKKRGKVGSPVILMKGREIGQKKKERSSIRCSKSLRRKNPRERREKGPSLVAGERKEIRESAGVRERNEKSEKRKKGNCAGSAQVKKKEESEKTTTRSRKEKEKGEESYWRKGERKEKITRLFLTGKKKRESEHTRSPPDGRWPDQTTRRSEKKRAVI